MSQSDLHWKERVKFGKGKMGETQFILWAESKGIKWLEYGFRIDEPLSPTTFTRLSPSVRMTPDFACMSKERGGFLVEVKGCGNDGIKVKQETLKALAPWDDIMDDVYFFVYNSATHACALISFEDMENLCKDIPISYFDSDHKPFHLVHNKTVAWEKLPKETKGAHNER